MSWPLVTLDAACSLVTDGTHYTPPNIGKGVPFLTVKDMVNGALDFEGCAFISEDDYQKALYGNSSPQQGDVLFSKDGTVGKVHVVHATRKFAVLSSIAILRPNARKLYSEYLGFVLRSRDILQQAFSKKTGSALQRIILDDLKEVVFPLPPLAEQRRIAAVLAKADRLRRLRRYALELGEEYVQSLFIDAFYHNASPDWDFEEVEALVKPGKGNIRTGPFGSQLLHSEFTDNGIAVLGIDNVVHNYLGVVLVEAV